MSAGFALTEEYGLKDCAPQNKYGTLGLFRAHQAPEVESIIVEKPGLSVAEGAIGIGRLRPFQLHRPLRERIIGMTESIVQVYHLCIHLMRERRRGMSMARFPKRTAYVACNGGDRCKTCAYGCMSCSSCMAVCRKRSDFYNIYGVAEVDEETCIGCGLCAKACPQEIIHVHPTDNPFVVKCSNREKAQLQKGLRGKLHRLRSLRENCPADALSLKDNVAVMDDGLCLACGNCAVKCPRDVIVDTRGIICK